MYFRRRKFPELDKCRLRTTTPSPTFVSLFFRSAQAKSLFMHIYRPPFFSWSPDNNEHEKNAAAGQTVTCAVATVDILSFALRSRAELRQQVKEHGQPEQGGNRKRHASVFFSIIISFVHLRPLLLRVGENFAGKSRVSNLFWPFFSWGKGFSHHTFWFFVSPSH